MGTKSIAKKGLGHQERLISAPTPVTAATMQEIVPNTRSGRALWAVTNPMMLKILRMLFQQLSGRIRDKYERPEQVSSSGSLSPACHLLCR